jgi:cytochrome c oxidase assembly protein subunit 11
MSGRAAVGQAVPSVAPNTAASHFSKTECFCFTRQPFSVGESKRMPVRFVVDSNLPEHIRTITLSYTFFDADRPA